MKRNGIKHILVAPYHPRSNGQAERFVQTFKQFFKAEGKTSASLKSNLARFLFSYRTTPNSTTGQTPAELFFSRRLRTRLDLLRPDLGRKAASKQSAPMRNQQVLLGFNRDPQKVQQYTCDSNENKMAHALWGPARVMGLMAMPLTR